MEITTQTDTTFRCIDVCLARNKNDVARLLVASLRRKLTPQERAKALLGLIDMVGEAAAEREKPRQAAEGSGVKAIIADNKNRQASIEVLPEFPIIERCKCGQQILLVDVKENGIGDSFVECPSCGKKSSDFKCETTEGAVLRWNRYRGDEPHQEEL